MAISVAVIHRPSDCRSTAALTRREEVLQTLELGGLPLRVDDARGEHADGRV
jgi:hypothetical protein